MKTITKFKGKTVSKIEGKAKKPKQKMPTRIKARAYEFDSYYDYEALTDSDHVYLCKLSYNAKKDAFHES